MGDMLQVNGKFLGSEGATLVPRNWIRQAGRRNNMPYDQFVHTIADRQRLE